MKIVQYLHRPNSTELGFSNTHDAYLRIDTEFYDVSEIFPPSIPVEIEDATTKKKYFVTAAKGREYRINQLGQLYRDYNVKFGDEILFTAIVRDSGTKIYFSVRKYTRVFLAKAKNGTDIQNIEYLSSYSIGDNKYNVTIYDQGQASLMEIEYSEPKKKREDSPDTTDYYNVSINGTDIPNGRYFLLINDRPTLSHFVKAELNQVVINDNDLVGTIKENNLTSHKGPSNLQQIFYGAPGTGKSHEVKILTKGESVVRTTFHPDSDYSTFVGAYKPTMGRSYEEILSLTELKVRLFETKAKGETYPCHKFATQYWFSLSKLSASDIKEILKECGFTESMYQEVNKGIAVGKEMSESKEDRIVYKFVAQAFLQAYVQAWRYYADAAENEPKKQFLVIEEINRGNCAQIFGDLFQLLDRNEYGFSEYYINADTDLKSYLAREFDGMSIAKKEEINGCYKKETDVVDRVLSGDILLLPNNLYIWATMNTSDQSLFPIDSAFKRRWDWVYIPIANVPEKKWKIVIGKKEFDWWGFIEKINAQIGATTNSEDKKLGFFFCQANDKGEITVDTFVNKVVFYLWNDVFKDYGFDNDLFKIADDKFLTFDKFYKTINGKTEIEIDNVQLFLSEKLGLSSEEVDESDDFEDDDDGNSTDDLNNLEKTSQKEKDYSQYSLNGEGRYNKGEVIIKAVEKYVADHPDLTSEEVLQNWVGLTKIKEPNPFPKPFMLSKDTYLEKKSQSRDYRIEQRWLEVIVRDDSIYVSNQMRITTFPKIIQIINSQDWGIHIEKVE